MKLLTIIVFFTLTHNTLCQDIPFFDSLDFFIRTKTKKIFIKTSLGGHPIHQSIGTFDKDKKSIQWCTNVIGSPKECQDPEPLDIQKGTIVQLKSYKHEYFFDTHGRITMIEATFPETSGAIQKNTHQYFYTDTVSKRIRLIISKASDTWIYIFTYFYSNNLLEKIVETKITLESNDEYTRVTTFEYYPDMRPKSMTTTNPGLALRMRTFTYSDD